MKKRLKWLLLGSLMCVGVGSVFQQGYGMKRKLESNEQQSNKRPKTEGIDLPNEMILYIMTFLDPIDVAHFGETCQHINQFSQDKILWKQQAIKSGASQVELEKVEKGFFSYKQIIIGYKYWEKFNEVKDSEDVTDKKKLTFSNNAAENGCEKAILYLLNAYFFGDYGLQEHDPQGLVLAQKYADEGSEEAIYHLLNAYWIGLYGLEENNAEGLKLAKEYAENGSQKAIYHLLNAYRDGWYRLNANDPQGLVFAEKYANQGSEQAIQYLILAHFKGWYGLQSNNAEGLKLAKEYAENGSQIAALYL